MLLNEAIRYDALHRDKHSTGEQRLMSPSKQMMIYRRVFLIPTVINLQLVTRRSLNLVKTSLHSSLLRQNLQNNALNRN